MNKIFIAATHRVTATDLKSAKLGARFGRLDLQSQLALLAVEPFAVEFEKFPRDRIAICLATNAGSLTTDLEFWKGNDTVGGPSPTLFAYTLPSAALGEIAIRHRLTGPNLCFIGNSENLLSEVADLLRRNEADGCACVYCNVISGEVAKLIGISTSASAHACFVILDR
ncbi:MAG TPA: hypothetical protein VHG71_01600 [Verrucomicrobiae bacterium]|nr:hypothetical protein [Verrucomicrobiae bacterium]